VCDILLCYDSVVYKFFLPVNTQLYLETDFVTGQFGFEAVEAG
jgi:hypothetical protein